MLLLDVVGSGSVVGLGVELCVLVASGGSGVVGTGSALGVNAGGFVLAVCEAWVAPAVGPLEGVVEGDDVTAAVVVLACPRVLEGLELALSARAHGRLDGGRCLVV
jgi:hypothetical protein